MKYFDVAVIGAGGAGMMCALTAGGNGRSVVLIDHASTIGKKILISGGGRCNFTNINAGPDNYLSKNPHFAKSALSRFTPDDFISLVEKHRIRYHEKKLGQLFCDTSAQEIVDMLVKECKDIKAKFWLNCMVREIRAPKAVENIALVYAVPSTYTSMDSDSTVEASSLPAHEDYDSELFLIRTSKGDITCQSLVIATGGLSVPKVGATGFGYDLARHFGIAMIETAPALDGFVFTNADMATYEELYGVAVDSFVETGGSSFRENILFTHKGLSGPASLQASLYWRKNCAINIDFCPDIDLFEALKERKAEGDKRTLRNILPEWTPKRLALRICEIAKVSDTSLQETSDKTLSMVVSALKNWSFVPAATTGFIKAEVTRGGVDTKELSAKTLESKKVPGLYFIGEVVDVTGQLGGYNFQWAWASGHSAGISA